MTQPPPFFHKLASRTMRSRRQMNRTQFGCQSNPSLHYFFLIVFSHCCVILLSSPVTALIAIPPSPTSGGRSAVKIRSRQNSSSSSELCSTLSFSGDASCTLEMKDASVESVSDFLQSPSSDIYLLGTSNCSKQDEENTGRSKQEKKTKEDGESQLWECKQPVVDFMGLTLQPVFVNKVLRASQGRVVVSIEDARTDIVKASKSPGSRAVTSILESSTFKGESVFSVQSPDDGLDESCTISIELRLTLLIPLPSYMPVPPGFNALGSAIVRRTGKSRTKKLLRRLREAYYEDCEEKSQNPTSNKSVSD